MAKAFYTYECEAGTFSFLQDEAIGAAMGNSAAAVGTPRMPDKLKPRKLSIRYGSSPYTYKRYVVGTEAQIHSFGYGDSIGGGTVCGFDYGFENAASL